MSNSVRDGRRREARFIKNNKENPIVQKLVKQVTSKKIPTSEQKRQIMAAMINNKLPKEKQQTQEVNISDVRNFIREKYTKQQKNNPLL